MYDSLVEEVRCKIDPVISIIPVDIFAICSVVNVPVERRFLKCDGYYTRISVDDTMSVLNYETTLSHKMRRYVIAHSLSHILLGHVCSGRVYYENLMLRCRPYFNVYKEQLASRLALDLVIPLNSVQRLVDVDKYTVPCLSDAYNVPERAICHQLGIV